MFSSKPAPKPKTAPGKRPGAGTSAKPDSKENLSLEGSLKRVLDVQGLTDQVTDDISALAVGPEADAPLVQLVNALLVEAVRTNCSDIHIEPFEGLLRVRFRVDGVLQEVQKIPHKLSPAITSRLKIMADLDICEKRIPQDGCIKLRAQGIEADYRMSTLPSVFGEKIVLRVMSSTAVNNDLSKLGIPTKQLSIIRDAITRPDGLVLVTGPTGSGKTTTLYAALNELNDISVSVFTAEDPVEGTLPGVTQSQVNATVGYTFATILRSLLRQDPDVILVGEIRDQETAEISIKAALTGHLVLSTLHTNCAVSTVSRLLNMGIAPYLVASSVSCIVAQRLVRRVCTECAKEHEAPPELVTRLGKAGEGLRGLTIKYGQGCKTCNGTGYKGRAPVYEVLTLSDGFRQMILQGSSREEMKAYARKEGMMTLREAGIELVRNGVTTLEEVLGATNEDSDTDPATQIEVVAATMPPMSVTPSTDTPAQVAPVVVAVEPAAATEPQETDLNTTAVSNSEQEHEDPASRWKRDKSV